MREVLTELKQWSADGEQVALATVVETWGSSPRPLGSKMVVTRSGKMAGSVSNGCIEGAVFDESRHEPDDELDVGGPRLAHRHLTSGSTFEGASGTMPSTNVAAAQTITAIHGNGGLPVIDSVQTPFSGAPLAEVGGAFAQGDAQRMRGLGRGVDHHLVEPMVAIGQHGPTFHRRSRLPVHAVFALDDDFGGPRGGIVAVKPLTH